MNTDVDAKRLAGGYTDESEFFQIKSPIKIQINLDESEFFSNEKCYKKQINVDELSVFIPKF